MYDSFDRTIRRTLKQLAKQRVRMVLQPGSYWVIENAGVSTEDTHAALMTCYMRGWIEPLPNAVPLAQIPDDFDLSKVAFGEVEQQYRLTSAGWSAIHRSSLIAVCALLISTLSFATVVIARLPVNSTPPGGTSIRSGTLPPPVGKLQYAVIRSQFPSLTNVPDLILVYREDARRP